MTYSDHACVMICLTRYYSCFYVTCFQNEQSGLCINNIIIRMSESYCNWSYVVTPMQPCSHINCARTCIHLLDKCKVISSIEHVRHDCIMVIYIYQAFFVVDHLTV